MRKNSTLVSDVYSKLLLELNEAVIHLHKEGGSTDIPEQIEIYWAAAKNPSLRTICEVGFNAGHSALLWLTASPNAKVVMFDLFKHVASPAGERVLRKYYNERLTIYKGASVRGLAQAFDDGVRCDLFSVDGSHHYPHAVLDVIASYFMTTTNASVFVDDTNCRSFFCVDDVIRLAKGALPMKILHRWQFPPTKGFERGLTEFRYVHSTPKSERSDAATWNLQASHKKI